MLSKYSKDQSEFDTFLVDLIKHITDLKETEQRIQLGEEQLVALNDNLISLPWNKFLSVLLIYFYILVFYLCRYSPFLNDNHS